MGSSNSWVASVLKSVCCLWGSISNIVSAVVHVNRKWICGAELVIMSCFYFILRYLELIMSDTELGKWPDFKCAHTGTLPREHQHWQCIILSVSWIFTSVVTRCHMTQSKEPPSPQWGCYNHVALIVDVCHKFKKQPFLHSNAGYWQAATRFRSLNSKEGCHLFPSSCTSLTTFRPTLSCYSPPLSGDRKKIPWWVWSAGLSRRGRGPSSTDQQRRHAHVQSRS